MALTYPTGVASGQLAGPFTYNDWQALLTGTMTDQPVFLNYTSAGNSAPALKMQTNATADLFQGLNSGGTLIYKMDGAGTFYAATGMSLGPTTGTSPGFVRWVGSSINSLEYFSPNIASTATNHFFVTWTGSAQVVPFSIGGQIDAALAWVDNSGNYHGGGVPTNRNGTAQSNRIFTGTSTPASPAVGDIWVKA